MLPNFMVQLTRNIRYKRNKQHYRITLFFSAVSLAGAFGGILAYVWYRLLIFRNGRKLTSLRRA